MTRGLLCAAIQPRLSPCCFSFFALNSSVETIKKKSNYNYKCSKSFKLLHCEQWSVYTWIFFWGGGAVSILCFYVVGPWIRSNKTLPLTESLLRWLRGLCCYLYICQVRKQITLSLFFWWSFKHARLSPPLIYFIWRRRNQDLTCIYTFRDYC